VQDDYDHYGYLQFFPAAKNIPKGTMRQIHDCDSRQYLGEIPEASETYNVVHYANEFGVSIGESTFGGISLLSTPYPGSIMDYGSLMTVALQRSKSARELINTMSELSMKYGYASNGESFSISDGNEGMLLVTYFVGFLY
jgi:dipeptidase